MLRSARTKVEAIGVRAEQVMNLAARVGQPQRRRRRKRGVVANDPALAGPGPERAAAAERATAVIG